MGIAARGRASNRVPPRRRAARRRGVGTGTIVRLARTPSCRRPRADPRDRGPPRHAPCRRGDAGARVAGPPGLEAWAATATRFDDAIASSSWTALHRHAAHGPRPVEPRLVEAPARQRLAAGVPTLAARFARAGWWTAAVTGGGWVSVPAGCPTASRPRRRLLRRTRASSIERWNGARPKDRPFFLFPPHLRACTIPTATRAPRGAVVATRPEAEVNRLVGARRLARGRRRGSGAAFAARLADPAATTRSSARSARPARRRCWGGTPRGSMAPGATPRAAPRSSRSSSRPTCAAFDSWTGGSAGRSRRWTRSPPGPSSSCVRTTARRSANTARCTTAGTSPRSWSVRSWSCVCPGGPRAASRPPAASWTWPRPS
jgi:hypothetical protein